MLRIILIACFTLILNEMFGQAKLFSDKKTVQAGCDKVMMLFKDSKFAEALDTLKQYSIIESKEIDAMQTTMQQQMNKASESYGKLLSSEFITERSVKEFYTRRVYALKFEQHFLKAYFSLYNNGSGWTVTYFGYTQDIEDLL